MAAYDDVAVPARVLCIASHVVHGYVGNRASVFPLQVLGFDVDVLNSCQLSNHTGYPVFKGDVVNAEQLDKLVDGLAANGLLGYDYVLTGYISQEAFLASVVKLLARVKAANPAARYVCDPVLGDNNKLYVAAEMVDAIRRLSLPLAHAITPNHYEAEWLTGLKIASLADIPPVLAALHAMGPKVVALTSTEVPEHPDQLVSVVSEAVDGAGTTAVTAIAFDKLGGSSSSSSGSSSGQDFSLDGAYFTGTGDCYAALLLAWGHLLGDGHGGAAMMRAQTTMQHVLKVTRTLAARRAGEDEGGGGEGRRGLTKGELARCCELAVVPSRRFIADPGPDMPVTRLSL